MIASSHISPSAISQGGSVGFRKSRTEPVKIAPVGVTRSRSIKQAYETALWIGHKMRAEHFLPGG